MNIPPTKTYPWRPAILLLVWIVSLACSLLPGYATPGQPTGTSLTRSEQVTETAKPAEAPATKTAATAISAADTATVGPYVLKVSDRYPFFETKVKIAQNLTARAGQLWIGTVAGTVEEVNPQSGTFGKSISLAPEGGSMLTVFPVQEMASEGKYLWVYAGFLDNPAVSPSLFAIEPETGKIVQQWDLNSPEWMQGYERGYATDGFGVSPGRIWIDGHIVDTETFEIKTVSMPGDAQFAYDGREWMWMTGELGGACDDLILVNANDPATERCEDDWPFFTHEASGMHPMGMGSPLVFTGDQVWMAGGLPAEKPGDSLSYLLEAYPADIEQSMKATGPLVSIPFLESASNIKLFFAGNTLWVLDTLGDKMGYLFQLDPKTGEIINSLDLVGDEGRTIGDLPMDIATEGNNLWVLTGKQLLRIKLP